MCPTLCPIWRCLTRSRGEPALHGGDRWDEREADSEAKTHAEAEVDLPQRVRRSGEYQSRASDQHPE